MIKITEENLKWAYKKLKYYIYYYKSLNYLKDKIYDFEQKYENDLKGFSDFFKETAAEFNNLKSTDNLNSKYRLNYLVYPKKDSIKFSGLKDYNVFDVNFFIDMDLKLYLVDIGFMFEILNLARLYNEYQNKYALRNKINIQERISLKHSINSILDRLSLGEENRIFLLETIFNISKTIEVKSMAFEIEGKRDKRKRKYDFYYDGFSFIQLIDYEDCNLQTKIFFNMYNITPEGMLLKLVENYPVIGLSATANFDSCIKNYDLNFLKYKINDKFIEMSNKEIEEFKQLGFETLKDYMEFLDYQQSKHI